MFSSLGTKRQLHQTIRMTQNVKHLHSYMVHPGLQEQKQHRHIMQVRGLFWQIYGKDKQVFCFLVFFFLSGASPLLIIHRETKSSQSKGCYSCHMRTWVLFGPATGKKDARVLICLLDLTWLYFNCLGRLFYLYMNYGML